MARKGKFDIMRNLGKVDRRTIRYNGHTASISIIMSMYTTRCALGHRLIVHGPDPWLTEGEATSLLVRQMQCKMERDGLRNVEAGAGETEEGGGGGGGAKIERVIVYGSTASA